MANLFSFTTAGATPKQGYLGGPTTPASPLGYGTTPASKALSNAPSFPGGSPALASTVNNAISAVKPTTPVKKVNNVDGSSTEYHAPAKGMTVEEYQAAVAAKSQPSSPGMIQAGTNQPSNNTGSQSMSNPTPTYPGLISSLTQNSLAGSPVAGQAASGLLNLQNDKKVEGARGKLAKQIGIDKQGIADIYSDPIPLEFQQGRAQVAQNLAAEREGVLQQQLANVLEERGQNITGLTSAGNLGNTAQGQLQSGLTSAAGFAAPQAYGLTTQPYNPLSDTYGGGGSGGALDRAALAGQIGATQQNTQNRGTASTEANQAVYQQGLGDLYKIGSQLQNVDGLGTMLLSTAKGGQVNPFDPTLANQTIAAFRTQLSNPDQIRFNSNLATFQAAAQALLASGGGSTPTDVGNKINGIASGTLSLGALKALVDQAKQEGLVRYNSQKAIVDGAFNSLNQGGSSASAGSSQGETVSAGGYNFKQVNGKWVPI